MWIGGLREMAAGPQEVLFNGEFLTVSTAAAFWASHTLLAFVGTNSTAATMVVGACAYLMLNTGLVSLVVSFAEGQSLKHVWPQCHKWTLPYFLVGAAVAGLAGAAGRGTNFDATLLVVPAMYFVYLYYRMHVVRAVLDNISNVGQENEAALLGPSRGR